MSVDENYQITHVLGIEVEKLGPSGFITEDYQYQVPTRTCYYHTKWHYDQWLNEGDGNGNNGNGNGNNGNGHNGNGNGNNGNGCLLYTSLNPGQTKMEGISSTPMDYVKEKVVEDLIATRGMSYEEAENYLYKGCLLYTS